MDQEPAVVAPTGAIRARVAVVLRRRWRSLAVAAAAIGVLVTAAGLGLHWLFADAAGVGLRQTLRWMGWTWFVAVGATAAVVVLRAVRLPRRAAAGAAVAVLLVACLGVPAGTWWTFMVDHEAARGAPFGETAVTEFFLAAFSRYRDPLDTEGEIAMMAAVDRSHRRAVLDQVRRARAILDAPAVTTMQPRGQDWNRGRFDLEMTGKIPATAAGSVAFEVVAEQTYPIDRWPYQGNARLGGHVWTFTVRRDGAGGWWVTGFAHPDICAAHRRGNGCQVTDPGLLPSISPRPSPSPSPSRSGFANWEFLPCGPRDPLREFHNCPSTGASP